MPIPIEIGWIITLIWLGLRKLKELNLEVKLVEFGGSLLKIEREKKDPTVTESCISVC